MQYICSEKPVFLLKKANALTGQSQYFDMAHATYCLCQRTALPFHSPFIVHRSSFIAHRSRPHKNRQYENQGNDGEEQPTAWTHGKGEPETLGLPVDKERHWFYFEKTMTACLCFVVQQFFFRICAASSSTIYRTPIVFKIINNKARFVKANTYRLLFLGHTSVVLSYTFSAMETVWKT